MTSFRFLLLTNLMCFVLGATLGGLGWLVCVGAAASTWGLVRAQRNAARYAAQHLHAR